MQNLRRNLLSKKIPEQEAASPTQQTFNKEQQTFNKDRPPKHKENTPVTSRVYTKERPRTRPHTGRQAYNTNANTQAKNESPRSASYAKDSQDTRSPKPHFKEGSPTQATKKNL